MSYIVRKNYENNEVYCPEGSSYPRFNANILNEIKIPVPKDMSKMKPLITKLHDTHIELTKLREEIPEKEKEVQNRIQEICDTEECDEYKLGDVCDMKAAPGGKSLQQHYSLEKTKYGFITGKNLNGNQDMTYLNEKGYEMCKNYTQKETNKRHFKQKDIFGK
jgi:restriction endonuclease S subunit